MFHTTPPLHATKCPLFHKLVLRPYKFRKEYLPYVPPSSTSSDCCENCHWSTGLSVLPDARSLSSKDDHFEHLIRYFTISNLATLSTVPFPLVPLFTTAHDICMSKFRRGGREWGHLYATHYHAPPRDEVSSFSQTHTLRSWSTPLLQEEHAYRSLTDTIQLLSLLSPPSLITRYLILFCTSPDTHLLQLA